MAGSPQISVLMPACNVEAFVAESIESVLAQTFPDFELLIVDDGSTDRTREIVRRYVEADPRIRLFERPHAGLAAARNDLVAQARCEFIAWLDSDDVAMPERLDKQYRFMLEHPECLAAGSAVLWIDADSDPICVQTLPLDHEGIDGQHMAGIGGAIIHPSSFMRRTAVMAVGGFRAEFPPAEDYDLYLRLAEIGKLANLPEVLTKYRWHDSNSSLKQIQRRRQATILALTLARQRRGLPEMRIELPQRPVPSNCERRRNWIGRALAAGYYHTARKHALRLLREEPWSAQSWRDLAAALLRHRRRLPEAAEL